MGKPLFYLLLSRPVASGQAETIGLTVWSCGREENSNKGGKNKRKEYRGHMIKRGKKEKQRAEEDEGRRRRSAHRWHRSLCSRYLHIQVNLYSFRMGHLVRRLFVTSQPDFRSENVLSWNINLKHSTNSFTFRTIHETNPTPLIRHI